VCGRDLLALHDQDVRAGVRRNDEDHEAMGGARPQLEVRAWKQEPFVALHWPDTLEQTVQFCSAIATLCGGIRGIMARLFEHTGDASKIVGIVYRYGRKWGLQTERLAPHRGSAREAQ
jgi:hypothetical protein